MRIRRLRTANCAYAQLAVRKYMSSVVQKVAYPAGIERCHRNDASLHRASNEDEAAVRSDYSQTARVFIYASQELH